MGRWSQVEVGQQLGPTTFDLTEDLHRRFLDPVGNELPDHHELVDPTIAGNFAIRLLGDAHPGPIIHSHQALRFHARVRVGDSVVGQGVVSLKEMRRGKAYVACECEFRRGEELVWWARMTCVWPEVHLRGEV